MSIIARFLLLTTLSIVIQGCNAAVPLDSLCAMPEWAEFDQEVKSAQISLRPWLEERQFMALQSAPSKGRAPASISEGPKQPDDTQELNTNWTNHQGLHKVQVQNSLGARDRESWTKWSHKKLKRLQDLIDQVEFHPERRQARDEFSKTANALVSFHGYAEQGKIASMLETLRKMRESSAKGHEQLCEKR